MKIPDSATVAKVCLEVAADVESRKINPGMICLYSRASPPKPNCAMGHVLYRLGFGYTEAYEVMGEALSRPHPLYRHAMEDVMSANDACGIGDKGRQPREIGILVAALKDLAAVFAAEAGQ